MQKRILLVEDDPFLVEIYESKFKEKGFDVVVAHNGEDALRKFAETQPSLVLLDIVLPKIDGWEVLRRMKKEAEGVKIPVIILSNLGQKEEIAKGLGLGASEYLIKAHFTPSEIVEKVNGLIGEGEHSDS